MEWIGVNEKNVNSRYAVSMLACAATEPATAEQLAGKISKRTSVVRRGTKNTA